MSSITSMSSISSITSITSIVKSSILDIPSVLVDIIGCYLEVNDLLESCLINKNVQKNLLNQLKYRTISEHYQLQEESTLTLCRYYHEKSPGHLQFFFKNIDMVFNYIQRFKIEGLYLSPRSFFGDIYIDDIREIGDVKIDKIIQKIVSNTTLTHVNLCMFSPYFTNEKKDELRVKLSNHPSLKWVGISHPYATTYFKKPPTSLYRNKDNEFIWRHFADIYNF